MIRLVSLPHDRVFELHAEFCKSLASPMRLKILYALREGERTVKELSEMIGASQSNISQHLAILRRRGIAIGVRRGQNIYYRIADPKIIRACDLIREMLTELLRREGEALQRFEYPKGE